MASKSQPTIPNLKIPEAPKSRSVRKQKHVFGARAGAGSSWKKVNSMGGTSSSPVVEDSNQRREVYISYFPNTKDVYKLEE